MDESKKPTVKMPAVAVDDTFRREILDPIMTAIASSAEETNSLVERCITDQIGIRTDLSGLVSRVEALEARGGSWDGRHSAHERSIVDGIAEAKRIASDVRHEVDQSLLAAAQRHGELAGKVDAVATNLEAMKKDIAAHVLDALGAHVQSIEEAADKLTKSPRVKTAASIGGAFAGSALVTAVIEIIKHL